LTVAVDGAATAFAATASACKINYDPEQALGSLYRHNPRKPRVSKDHQGRFVDLWPGQRWRTQDWRRTVGYINIAAASFGLQVAAQTFSYALVFMADSALTVSTRKTAMVGPSDRARASWLWPA
jgi:hypothetical protein